MKHPVLLKCKDKSGDTEGVNLAYSLWGWWGRWKGVKLCVSIELPLRSRRSSEHAPLIAVVDLEQFVQASARVERSGMKLRGNRHHGPSTSQSGRSRGRGKHLNRAK
jgi:hypothetical protein